ncbi:hypothetical protein [Rhizobium rhizogenes]|uniref:hypothetical protein n=1 Tax=Rhizobium rhizogenes TaxID=359 RepID=UPI001572D163|nr:hypothetical protein [Rhizobium rhizogenes]NTG07120.1 hypothetical protein [Rhizobium rhizogenes]
MMAVTVVPPSDSRESRLERALRAEYPLQISAWRLSNLIGLSWQDDPVRSFTLLCVSFHKLNQDLSGTGWQAVRTDGTPDALYSLSPVGGG